MQVDFEQEWRAARALENAGSVAAAKAIYDRLIAAGPDRLYVRLRLSAIEQGAGHYRAAREHARLAADAVVRTARWKDLGAVTRRLLTFDEHAQVHALITSVDWTDPEIQREAAVLSQHLWLIDHVGEALDLIAAAMPRMARSPNLSYSRANALKYLGRMEEATAEYERCLTLEPTSPHAHWSLAYHSPSAVPGARVPRVLAAQAAHPADSPEQAYFHYALFKEFDDANDVDSAWKHLAAGAAIKRRTLRYDRAQERAGVDALEKLATREFILDREPLAASHTPVFVVGMPRSGTTLLERILGNHADVRAGGELNDFNTVLSIASDRFVGAAATPVLAEQVRGLDFRAVGAEYLARTADKAREARFLVDKNPINFLYAGLIAKAMPNARILCLRRAPMDACFSNLKELFSNEAYGYSYDLAELGGHYLDFTRLCDHWARAMPENFLVVDYESLVADPVAQAQRVLAFCQLPFSPDILDITRNTAPVATASSSQVRKPINQRGVGAWRKYAGYLEPLRLQFEQAGLPA